MSTNNNINSIFQQGIVQVVGTHAYALNQISGGYVLTIIDISTSISPVVKSVLFDAVNFYQCQALAISGNYAYVINSLSGTDATTHPGLVIINISNPLAPVIVGTLLNGSFIYNGYGIVVQGNYAYVVNFLYGSDASSKPGFVVVDVSAASIPRVVASILDSTNIFLGYNISLVAPSTGGNYAFIANSAVGGDETAHPKSTMIDVTLPTVPVVVPAYRTT